MFPNRNNLNQMFILERDSLHQDFVKGENIPEPNEGTCSFSLFYDFYELVINPMWYLNKGQLFKMSFVLTVYWGLT